MKRLFLISLILVLFPLAGCITGGGGGDIIDGGNETTETDSTETDTDTTDPDTDLSDPDTDTDTAEADTDEVTDPDIDIEIPEECGEGFVITGVIRLEKLVASPPATGTDVIVKHPCGREEGDPSKATCGTGHVAAWLCTTPDCSAAGDPIDVDLNTEGSLLQSSFDFEPFSFCELQAGSYYILPIIDHDESGTLTNYDWTMGIKDLGDSSVTYPARVHGYPVEITDSDVALGEGLSVSSSNPSPITINYFNYRHPTPSWQTDDAHLFIAASMHPDVSTTGMGMRHVNLATHTETDMIAGTDPVDAASFADLEGVRYEGDFTKLGFHNNIAYLATDDAGVIFTAILDDNGGFTQGESIDLITAGMEWGYDNFNFGTAFDVNGRTYLAFTTRGAIGAPLPHQPDNPLVVVDVSELQADGSFTFKAFNETDMADLYQVRFDELMAVNGMLFAAETGHNSRARDDDMLNQLWTFTFADLDTPTVFEHASYAGADYNAEGDVPECGSNPPYRKAGLWAGEIDGQIHAFLGNLRTVSMWRFASAAALVGERVQYGSGIDTYDPRFDDYAIGFSNFRANPDNTKLFAFGDCKSRYLAVRDTDWAGGEGVRTQSRRRIAPLDLTTLDSTGFPVFDTTIGDASTAPDLVREGLNGTNQTLSEERVPRHRHGLSRHPLGYLRYLWLSQCRRQHLRLRLRGQPSPRRRGHRKSHLRHRLWRR